MSITIVRGTSLTAACTQSSAAGRVDLDSGINELYGETTIAVGVGRL